MGSVKTICLGLLLIIVASLSAGFVNAAVLNCSNYPTCNMNMGFCFSGDAFELGQNPDQLELREFVSNVDEVITEEDLTGLRGGQITTQEGTTDYDQYIRFTDGSYDGYVGMYAVNYLSINDASPASYLVLNASKSFIEWEIQFDEGLESYIESDGRLEDLEDKNFNIMGVNFTIVSAVTNADGSNFSMTLFGGGITDTLRESERKVYFIDGKQYNVTLVSVSEFNSSGTSNTTFLINGNLTPDLGEGDFTLLSDGQYFSVRDILVNAREGVATFHLGNKIIVFSDNLRNLNSFSGYANINNMTFANSTEISGSVMGSFAEISSIKYRVFADPENNSIAYLPSGNGNIRNITKNPVGIISDSFSIVYSGLTTQEKKNLSLFSSGDDSYNLTFTNIKNNTYSIPLITNEGGVFKFGSDNDDLVFVEASSSTYNIGTDDYFIITNGASDDRSITNILKYVDYDLNNSSLEFLDLSNDEIIYIPVIGNTSGNAVFVVENCTHFINVSNVSDPMSDIAVDLMGDGDINEDVVGITMFGNARLEVNSSIYDGLNYVSLKSVVGNGKSITSNNTAGVVRMILNVAGRNFDANLPENTLLRILQRSNNSIDLSFDSTDYSGPHTNHSNDYQRFYFSEVDSENKLGMTDYGILIHKYASNLNNSSSELTFEIPKKQLLPQVFVTLDTVNECAYVPYCGDGVVDSGETCTSCIDDVGACVASSGGGGGGGGGAPVPAPELSSVPEKAVVYSYTKYSFNANGQTHSLSIKRINQDNVTIILKSDPVEVTLKRDEGRNIDLDKDGVFDVYVKLLSFTQQSATFDVSKPTVQRISVEVSTHENSSNISELVPIVEYHKDSKIEDSEKDNSTSDAVNPVVTNYAQKSTSYEGWVVASAIVVLLTIAFVVFSKKRK